MHYSGKHDSFSVSNIFSGLKINNKRDGIFFPLSKVSGNSWKCRYRSYQHICTLSVRWALNWIGRGWGNTKGTGIRKCAFLCWDCSYLLCWDNSRISKVTQVHFEVCSSDRSDPHFSTRTERCVISTESRSRGGADDSSVTGWTKPQQHKTFSFADVYF